MSILTNKHGLPESLVSALSADWYSQPGHISVTGLIQPPRIRQLMARYADQIEEDASDKIWMLLGSAVHDVLQRADTTHGLQEERLATTVRGWKVTGKADLWEKGTLFDFKVTSVWATVDGPKPDWVTQLNIYGYLYRQAGFATDKLQVACIYRDWSRGRAKQKDGYPQCAAGVLDVPIWSDAQVEQYLHDRIALHQEAEELDEADLPECTPEERWEKPTRYAVMKKNRKSAVRVLDNIEAAESMATEKGTGHYVETRPGTSVRCDDYCPVRPWCSPPLV